jgi:hypothetical protein
MVYLLVGDNRPMGMNWPDTKDKDNSLAIRKQVVVVVVVVQSLYMQHYSPKAPGVDQHSHPRGWTADFDPHRPPPAMS